MTDKELIDHLAGLVKRLTDNDHCPAGTVDCYSKCRGIMQEAADALTALAAENERLREALEKKGKTQIYIDGFDAAVSVSDSYRCHVTWGPDATPDDGLKEGIRGIQTVLRQSRAALTGKENPHD